MGWALLRRGRPRERLTSELARGSDLCACDRCQHVAVEGLTLPTVHIGHSVCTVRVCQIHTQKENKVTKAPKGTVETPQAWGARQAAAAPSWSDAQWRRAMACLGVTVTGSR